MAFTGQVLENPISGERITFRKTTEETDGKLLVIDLELSPNGHVPGTHTHPVLEERFEIVKGTMKFRKGLRTIKAGPGDKVVVPPRTIHRFENAGETPAMVRVEVRPAMRMEDLFEKTAALAREGRTTATGRPKALDLALFMREFEAEVRAPILPAALIRVVMAPLARLAKRRGLDSRYRKAESRAPQSRRDSRRPGPAAPETKGPTARASD